MKQCPRCQNPMFVVASGMVWGKKDEYYQIIRCPSCNYSETRYEKIEKDKKNGGIP